MHVDVRPPPYRDYDYGNPNPLAWMDSAPRLDTKLAWLLKLRVRGNSASSSSANVEPDRHHPPSPPEVIPAVNFPRRDTVSVVSLSQFKWSMPASSPI